MKQSFEEFLSDRCTSHTNNEPAGFEKWLEQLDGEEYMRYAQDYGEKCFGEGKVAGMDRAIELLKEPTPVADSIMNTIINGVNK